MHGVHSPDLMFKNYIENSPSIFFLWRSLYRYRVIRLYLSVVYLINVLNIDFKIFLNKGLLLMSLKILAIFVTDKN